MSVKIYEFEVVEGYEWVVPTNEADFEVFRTFDGTPLAETWHPVPMRMIQEDYLGRPLRDSDAPWLGKHTPVLRRGATGPLADVLESNGELLPLECRDEHLVVFNATRVLDALDEDRSSLVRFPSTGRIMKIEAHVFLAAAIADVPVFKIPQMLRGSVFVSDEVVRLTEGSGLKGIGFRQVWAAES